MPLTAAMTGFVPPRLLRPPKPLAGMRVLGEDEAVLSAFHSFRSWPAQKARPVPVMTAQRSVGSASYQVQSASRAKCCGRGIALSCLGRLSVTRRMCSAGKDTRTSRTGGGGEERVRGSLGDDGVAIVVSVCKSGVYIWVCVCVL